MSATSPSISRGSGSGVNVDAVEAALPGAVESVVGSVAREQASVASTSGRAWRGRRTLMAGV